MAEIIKQFEIELTDRVGGLSEVTEALQNAGVNLLATNAWARDGRGYIQIITADPDPASAVLKTLADRWELADVVAVRLGDRVGALHTVAEELAEAGIAIRSCYATTTGGETMLILDTADNARAAELL